MGSACGCGCSGEKKASAKVSWTVPEIRCEGSAGELEGTLKAVAGVKCVSVQAEDKKVSVSFDPTLTSEALLLEVLGQEGFSVA